MIPKNIGEVTGASKITHFFDSFLREINKEEQGLVYSPIFQEHFRIVRALLQLYKIYKTFYRSKSRWQ